MKGKGEEQIERKKRKRKATEGKKKIGKKKDRKDERFINQI